jgi:c-di-GMP-binding flagellar brake protein YcgR
MTVLMTPTPGEDVEILAPPNSRLRGLVTGRGPEALTIELDQKLVGRPFRFAAGHEVRVEWMNGTGLLHVSARVAEARPEPEPVLELDLLGTAQRVERRRYERRPVELEVWAWTLTRPTRRLRGTTLDLSPGGALLWLPDLAPGAARVDLTIVLPDWRLHASAGVRRRREPALVGVDFDRIALEEQARLAEFLRRRR